MRDRGELEEAEALYRQALEASHALGAQRDEANVAASLARLGDPKLVLDRQMLARWRQEYEQGEE